LVVGICRAGHRRGVSIVGRDVCADGT
jgi:hypothetical protein